MEITSCTKSYVSPELGVVGGDFSETKCVKRRRRSTSTVAISNNHQQGDQQISQTTPLAAMTMGTTTTAVKRSSRFRGVSSKILDPNIALRLLRTSLPRHRWTGRYEAHLWDKGSWNATQKKKGKQVYLGAYDEEEAAARAYDLAAIKYWGPSTFTNFPISNYDKEIEIMQNMTREEYLATLRRKSSGFARGVSKYRGVAKHHQNGRWEARIGRVFGNKYLYLGTYGTQEEAAQAYDIAAIEYRGINAITNFDLSTYIRSLRPNPPELTPNNETIYITTSNNLNPVEQPKSFAINDTTFPPKHEIIERKMPLGPWSKPSCPTALSLLLRSSMFKQLVEKTTSISANGETEEKGVMAVESRANDGGFELYTRNDNNNDANYYTCPSNIDNLMSGVGQQLLNKNASPSYDQTAVSFWNDIWC